MEVETAMALIKKIVKNNSTNDTRHIDLGLVPTEERAQYQKALIVIKLAILEGKLAHDEFSARVHLG
jgi:hypothetical protein